MNKEFYNFAPIIFACVLIAIILMMSCAFCPKKVYGKENIYEEI